MTKNSDYSATDNPGKKTTFQPRVEAEEGEPTHFDYVVLAFVVVFIVLAFLWAFGLVTIPGINF